MMWRAAEIIMDARFSFPDRRHSSLSGECSGVRVTSRLIDFSWFSVLHYSLFSEVYRGVLAIWREEIGKRNRSTRHYIGHWTSSNDRMQLCKWSVRESFSPMLWCYCARTAVRPSSEQIHNPLQNPIHIQHQSLFSYQYINIRIINIHRWESEGRRT